MTKTRLEILFEKYLNEEISLEELKTLQSLMQYEYQPEVVDAALRDAFSNKSMLAPTEDYDINLMLQEAIDKVSKENSGNTRHRTIVLRKTRWAVAAAVLLIIGTAMAYYFFSNQTDKSSLAEKNNQTQDVQPALEGALLTLEDGTTVVLDSLGNGLIASQKGSNAMLKNGTLAYTTNERTHTDTVSYNTLTTPRGRQFSMTLPDGSKVWLNAASSITYPTVFSEKERRVKITGEAYFEVNSISSAKNGRKKPFIVTCHNQEVEVLGTHFNINSYDDEEKTKTTLLEGKVQVRTPKNQTQQTKAILLPGQQSIIEVSKDGSDNRDIQIRSADVMYETAWRHNLFSFASADIKTVMRQLSRWYNVDVQYEGKEPPGKFNGEIGRSLTLAQVLKGLSATGVKFEIKDRSIFIHQNLKN